MPFYDYVCVECGEKIELFHGINDTSDKMCKCGETLKKEYNKTFGMKFIGDGFYSTRKEK